MIVDDWILFAEDNRHTATLQLLNTILCVSGLETPLGLADLEHPDPSAVLSDLQEKWQSGIGVKMVARKNLLTPALLFSNQKETNIRKNYTEFWRRWASNVLNVSAEEIALTNDLLISWLLTLTSSSYRPLRHAASLAAYSIVSGCCSLAVNLFSSLDDSAKLQAIKKTSKTGYSRHQIISATLAAIEGLIQNIFNAVFVQRFKDVDPSIRHESIKSLCTWIIAYPAVFLDNSYLRYLGWAFYDREAIIRTAALHSITTLVEEGGSSFATGLEDLLDRFLDRILEITQKDIDLGVRDACAMLLKTMLAHNVIPDRNCLHFIYTLARNNPSKEISSLIEHFVFSGQPPTDHETVFFKLMESIEEIISTPLSKESKISRRSSCLLIESLIYSLKNNISSLKNIELLVSFFMENSSKIRIEPFLHLMQSCIRYAFVNVNKVPDTNRAIDPLTKHNVSFSRDLWIIINPVFVDPAVLLNRFTNADEFSLLFDIIGLVDPVALDTSVIEALDTIINTAIEETIWNSDFSSTVVRFKSQLNLVIDCTESIKSMSRRALDNLDTCSYLLSTLLDFFPSIIDDFESTISAVKMQIRLLDDKIENSTEEEESPYAPLFSILASLKDYDLSILKVAERCEIAFRSVTNVEAAARALLSFARIQNHSNEQMIEYQPVLKLVLSSATAKFSETKNFASKIIHHCIGEKVTETLNVDYPISGRLSEVAFPLLIAFERVYRENVFLAETEDHLFIIRDISLLYLNFAHESQFSSNMRSVSSKIFGSLWRSFADKLQKRSLECITMIFRSICDAADSLGDLDKSEIIGFVKNLTNLTAAFIEAVSKSSPDALESEQIFGAISLILANVSIHHTCYIDLPLAHCLIPLMLGSPNLCAELLAVWRRSGRALSSSTFKLLAKHAAPASRHASLQGGKASKSEGSGAAPSKLREQILSTGTISGSECELDLEKESEFSNHHSKSVSQSDSPLTDEIVEQGSIDDHQLSSPMSPTPVLPRKRTINY